MMISREIRRRARLVVGPVLGICLVGYFAYHLVQGDRGLLAWMNLTQQIKIAQKNLADSREAREALERRVALLKPDSLDLDLLDERVRATINLALPNEIVISQQTLTR